jgi:hypothetical protein
MPETEEKTVDPVGPAHEVHEFIPGTGDVNVTVRAERGYVRVTAQPAGLSPDKASEVAGLITTAAGEAQAQRDAGHGPPEAPTEPAPEASKATEKALEGHRPLRSR